MSDSHEIKTVAPDEPGLHEHPVDFKSYSRRCAYIFTVVICAVGLMVFVSYLPHYGWPAKVTVILAIACFNAFLVAGFLMHLLSEKKLVYTLLAFTVFFVIGLAGLTLYAMQDFPSGTLTH